MFQLFLICLILKSVYSLDFLCTEEFCTDYLTKNKCPEVPNNCKIQNSTNNGLVLPFPLGPCNCCNFCLENLKRGDKCSIGTPSSKLPTNICGDKLGCKSNNVCETVDNKCTQAQKSYDDKKDKGEIGHLQVRPNCDRNGLYEPFFCIPGEICYCVDQDGNRIFGEIPYTSAEYIRQKCRCSREINSISKVLGKELHRDEHLRCTSDGGYDSIQCLEDKCLCVDNEDAKPTYPDQELVNVTDISNITMPCFEKKVHVTGRYYRPCEEKYLEKRKDVLKVEQEDYQIYGDVYPNCQLDGFYAGVQKNESHQFCVYPDGSIIKDYVVPLGDPLAKNMDCNCARTNLLIENDERPECLENGNYKKLQCRRGLCRCVDSNGHQIEKEVKTEEQQLLSCYQA